MNYKTKEKKKDTAPSPLVAVRPDQDEFDQLEKRASIEKRSLGNQLLVEWRRGLEKC